MHMGNLQEVIASLPFQFARVKMHKVEEIFFNSNDGCGGRKFLTGV